MSSSDSDDEFSAKKLRLARERCRKMLQSKIVQDKSSVKITGKNDQAEGSNSVADVDNTVNTSGNTENFMKNVENLDKSNSDSFIDSVEQDMLIDEIIKKNTAPARGRGRGKGRGRGRGRKKNEPVLNSAETPEIPTPIRGRSRGGNRGRASKNNLCNNEINNALLENELLNNTCGRKRSRYSYSNSSMIDILSTISSNRRGRNRNRFSCSTNSTLDELILEGVMSGNVSRRGRGQGRVRQRGTGRGQIRQPLPPMYPTYSVGNTDEYPDNSDDIPLFSKNHTNNVPVNVTDDEDVVDTEDLDDNETLSVKVIWKSLDIFKFLIHKHQKLNQIFDTFARKENVDKDKLLFTYNNKILSCDDTPASIDYSVAKFIDGGVVSQSLKRVTREKSIVNGIHIKFQCQNTKKPLEITIGKDDKISLALTQCAERLGHPINKLKFEFDGDSVTGTQTPQQMGLDNGDCIDVMILN